MGTDNANKPNISPTDDIRNGSVKTSSSIGSNSTHTHTVSLSAKGSHSHNITLNLKYVNLLLCIKN